MTTIKLLSELSLTDLRRLIVGYTAHEVYRVRREDTGDTVTITLRREVLAEPYVKRFDVPDEAMLAHYRSLLPEGYSFGAYAGAEMMGLAIGEGHQWNGSLWVWELHVLPAYRGRGIGLRLLEAVAEKGRAAGMRTLVCETQNTNAPGIAFYRRAGFSVDGVDLSYYSNDDYPDGEIALFMKRVIG